MKSLLNCFWATAVGCCAVLFNPSLARCETLTVQSPDQSVKVDVKLGDQMTYNLTYHGNAVLSDSKLGLKFKGQDTFSAVQVLESKITPVDQTWTTRFSKQSVYQDKCNELTVSVEEKSAPKRLLNLVFRVYNDGIAFRYVVPEQQQLNKFVLEADQTEYTFPADEFAWMSVFNHFNSSQEQTFEKQKLSSITPKSFVICPLVVETEKYCAAITEAELTDWSGAQFTACEKGNAENGTVTLKTLLTPRRDRNGCVVGQANAQSPWRVILLGEKPIDLINNSGIILNVSAPCALEDTSWIEPGVSSWDWWPVANKDLSTETLKKRIDFSAQMGWKYTTVDDPWYFNSKFQRKPGMKVDTTAGNDKVDIQEALAYAKSKGVRIFLWLHYQDILECGVEKTFQAYEKWGAAGVKIDFMDCDHQEMVNWIADVTKLGAKYHLMVNFHGMYKPTGLQRAYPNQITREAVRGNEYNKFTSGVTTTHQTTIPFTRFLCGPGDYTPGGFRNRHLDTFTKQHQMRTPPCQEIGTRAHALALCCLYDSPLMTLCDDPSAYQGQPGVEFLKNLPSVWEQTQALDGKIGEYLVQIRRTGETFYLGAITNQQPRKTSVSLSFLKPGCVYQAQLFSDVPESAQDAEKIAVKTVEVKSTDVLELDMVRDGGFCAIFQPKK